MFPQLISICIYAPAASAKKDCRSPGSAVHAPLVEKTARPSHNFLIRAARTWIQGLSDWVEVVFALPLKKSIVIIPFTLSEALASVPK
jgi:hypothetical protein